MGTKVKLRQKPISGNRQSLYLDFYPPIAHPETGKLTRREFLNLFLFNEVEFEEQKYLDHKGKEKKRFIPVLGRNNKPKSIKLNILDKQHNKNVLQLAEQIRQKRDNQLNKPEIYSGYELEQLKIKERGEASFVEYFQKLAEKRKASNHDNWISAYKYLKDYTNGNLRFENLTEMFCDNFKEHLLTTRSNRSSKTSLSQNSAVSYFNKFKAALRQAYKDGYLKTDLNARVQPIKQVETQRNFLTLEELNRLVNTDCKIPIMKKAALFSALTGLRFSDINKLIWGELEYIEGQGYFVRFRQKKTLGSETLPISEQAFNLLGERKESDARVFDGLKYSDYNNRIFYKWIWAAGISKEITFHCFRHTYAVLQISNRTDLYTVSKLMGHREIKTTQVYAKVMDKAKREAADKIKLNL